MTALAKFEHFCLLTLIMFLTNLVQTYQALICPKSWRIGSNGRKYLKIIIFRKFEHSSLSTSKRKEETSRVCNCKEHFNDLCQIQCKRYFTCKFSTRDEFNSTYGQSSHRGYILKRVEISTLRLFQPCLNDRVEISTWV